MHDATAGARAMGKAPVVLVVDDDSDARAICQRALSAAGYRTAAAASGAEALARLDVLTPDLVILDLAMPGTDGFATARAIRRRSGLADTPILIFTGLAEDARARAREAGATAFCTKPLEPQRLIAEVRRLCPLG